MSINPFDFIPGGVVAVIAMCAGAMVSLVLWASRDRRNW